MCRYRAWRMNAPSPILRARIKNDAYFTLDPRPGPALFMACPELLQIITGISEPFCGGGHLAEDFMAQGLAVFPSDLVDYGYKNQWLKQDFFHMRSMPMGCNSILSNPIYDRYQIDALIAHALDLLPPGGILALLLNHRFDAAGERSKLFMDGSGFYARVVLPFRIWLFQPKKGAKCPAQDHSWFLWRKGWQQPSKSVYLPADLFPNFSRGLVRSPQAYC